MTLATLINDAPINKWDESQGTAWRPKNSPPTYSGPTRVRIGLATSKNVMAVRTLREVGLDEARQYLTRFGFELDQLPRSETIALGAGSLTPMKMAQGFSVFANGGYYVEPFYISRIDDAYGNTVIEAHPKTICRDACQTQNRDPLAEQFNEQDEDDLHAPQVISEQNAFILREMMYSNIWGGGNWREGTGWNGTGWRAQTLNRRDIGGKTGTTNDSKDAWYNGYGPGLVAIAWVGFDDHSRALGRTTLNRNLGKDVISGAESGAKTAQPAWIDFMQQALDDVPQQEKVVPADIIRVRIDRDTGLLTHKVDESSMFEYFIKGTEPTQYVTEHSEESIYSSSGDGGDNGLF
jgi:penicillin-binding protein 1A